jgi:outer membrane protein insertion porin family
LLGFFLILTSEGMLVDPRWRLLVAVGFCGSYTTFSSYAFETFAYIEQGQWLLMVLNVLAVSEVLERVRRAWEDRGYFKVQAHGDASVLTSSPTSERIAVTVQVDEGQQYRLEDIRFNNRAISNVDALRSLFPLKDGDIFSREEVAKGLDNLRFAYRQLGYINFTSIPNTQFNDERQAISLGIDIDEGKQFYVSSVGILGRDDHVLKDSLLKRGNVYDQRLVDLFLQERASSLPTDASPDSRIHLRLNERAGTVAVTFDFRPCPLQEQP